MPAPRSASVVIAGAGIAGVATAYFLTVRHGVRDVVLCDPRPPLSLTSDKSTECYRNLWPNRPMVGLMNRSIDLLEELATESGNAFGLNRRGYLYATASLETLAALEANARRASDFGAGEVRVHRGGADQQYRPAVAEGWEGAPDGADLIADPDVLQRHFPGISPDAVGALHVRRAGWLSAQQLGAYLLERSRDAGLIHVRHAVTAVEHRGGAVQAVTLDDGSTIGCGALVDAAGPMLGPVAAMVGESLPVHSEVHHKVGFRDTLGVFPRDAGLLIWSDPQRLDWTADERRLLEDEGRTDLLGELPIACHGRPEGRGDSPWVLALWEYRRTVTEPVWPLPEDPLYGEVVIRGLRAMFPAMARYLDRMPQQVVDGGYYTKTIENRPLAGPMRTRGAFVAGALSGFGVMAACGVADLVAAHVTAAPLPEYAPAFGLERYDDPEYQREIAQLTETGQL
ncbi:MAG TPA: FAD-dependent oxidoreductase [Acidimicrobiia bacterium]|nr:FAD-dependent oxidoreductase [Acidimicrobiia bacterium]